MIEDTFGRPLGSLRISVTDRCNLRCRYCMPEEEYVWLPRQSILTFEETRRLVGVFTNLGVSKVRITGGEPLMRHDLASLVAMLGENPAIEDLAMTTNAVLLPQQAQALAAAGLHRLTISLDTLRPERFRQFTRRANRSTSALCSISSGSTRIISRPVALRRCRAATAYRASGWLIGTPSSPMTNVVLPTPQRRRH